MTTTMVQTLFRRRPSRHDADLRAACESALAFLVAVPLPDERWANTAHDVRVQIVRAIQKTEGR